MECVNKGFSNLYCQILLQTSWRLDAFHAPITAHITHSNDSKSDSSYVVEMARNQTKLFWCGRKGMCAGWDGTKKWYLLKWSRTKLDDLHTIVRSAYFCVSWSGTCLLMPCPISFNIYSFPHSTAIPSRNYATGRVRCVNPTLNEGAQSPIIKTAQRDARATSWQQVIK